MGRRGAVMTRDAVSEEELDFGFHEERDPTVPTDDRVTYTRAGPVKVIKPDGAVEIRPAYTPEEFEKVVKR